MVWKVEQWVSFGKPGADPRPGLPMGVRRDAFEFIDILAIDADGIVAIQACTSGRKEHWDMIVACKYALPWLRAGGKIELWSWTKKKRKRGGVAVRWTPKIEQITEVDCEKKNHDAEEKVNADKSERSRGREQEELW